MRKLPRPTDTCRSTFAICVSRVRDTAQKNRLTAVEEDIVQADVDYVAAAEAATLHNFPQATGVGHAVPDAELRDLYRQLVDKRSPGRSVYERLMSAARFGTCPLCGENSARTLDHHLPRAHFAAVAVAPSNLVPACRDCQSAKLETFPSSAGEQTLHPYFDDAEVERWLIARVVETAPPAFVFDVDPPAGWPAEKHQRHERHLSVFQLKTLFACAAARELVNMRWRLRALHAVGGAAAVRSHLAGEAASRRAAWLNSWQTAMYEACASSDWFCETGFALE
jgi:5-methylcytosine-specific restriction endonuclease McrA